MEITKIEVYLCNRINFQEIGLSLNGAWNGIAQMKKLQTESKYMTGKYSAWSSAAVVVNGENDKVK